MPKKLGKDKSLTGNVKTKDIRIQIKELIKYEKNKTRI